MSTASDSRFPSDVEVADISVNAGGRVLDVSANLSGVIPGLSEIPSGPAPHEDGGLVAVTLGGVQSR